MGTKVAVVMILASFLSGWFLHLAVSSLPIFNLGDHENVANKINIYDMDRHQILALKFEGWHVSIYGIPLLQQFPPGYEYKSSRWGFYEPNTGNLEAFMLVSGPGIDGRTYGCEITRAGWNRLEVSTPNGVFYFPTITDVNVVSLGYLGVEFIP